MVLRNLRILLVYANNVIVQLDSISDVRFERSKIHNEPKSMA